MLAVAFVSCHPALWILALETLAGHLPDAPLGTTAAHYMLQQVMLTMRYGLSLAIVMSDSARSSRFARGGKHDEARNDVILGAIDFIVTAQHRLCSRFDCRRKLFVHPDTQPRCNILDDGLNSRQLTTTSTFTRMDRHKRQHGLPSCSCASVRRPLSMGLSCPGPHPSELGCIGQDHAI